MRTTRILTAALLLAFVPSASAQTPGAVDLSFRAGSFVNGRVNSVVPAGDNTVYIAGSFTTVRGAVRHGIARLNGDGNVDETFDPGSGADWSVTSVALQADGKVLISGDFTSYDGVARNRIARLNTDGSLDTSFNPGNGPNDYVHFVASQASGKVLILGDFTSYNGVARSRIARLNADGSLDTEFNPGSKANSYVSTALAQADGRVLIAGNFTTYDGVARNRIARINQDGSLDAGFNPGSGPNNLIYSAAAQADGKVLIGGQFTNYNGVARNRIARLNQDGSLDTSFAPGSGASGLVRSVAVQADGKALIIGGFNSYNGVPRGRLARINTDGSLDTSFDPGSSVNSDIKSVASQTNGKVVIGGQFTSFAGVQRNFIARINEDGSLDTQFTPGSGAEGNGWGNSVAVQADGKVLIGGYFSSYDGVTRNRIARLNEDGSLDASFDPGSGLGPTNNSFTSASSIKLQPDGKVLIGGHFETFNGVARSRIARLNEDGSLDTSFDPGSGVSAAGSSNRRVHSVAVQADGKVLIGGNFTSFNGVARNGVARLNANGSLDVGFSPGAGINDGGYVTAVAVKADGKILIGGQFTSYNGVARNRIARLNEDGSLDTSFTPGSGANWSVASLALQADNKVLIGGDFSSYDGVARNRIARLNTDGSLDTGFNPGSSADDYVSSLALQADGKLLIAGGFTSFNGVARRGIARLNRDGSLDAGFNPGAGVNGYFNSNVMSTITPNASVASLAMEANGKVLFGGNFTSYNSAASSHLARVHNDPATQSLWTVGETEIFWARGESAPEVERVVFYLSTDQGTSWTILGAGERAVSGWRLTGVNLPPNRLLRAQGFLNDGGIVEFVGDGVPKPTITDISPTNVTGSDYRQWIAIRGAGFASGAEVILRTGLEEYLIPVTRTQFVSPAEIRVFVNLTSIAAEWTAQVRNPAGQTSSLFTFQVGAPAVLPEVGIDFGTLAPGSTVQRIFTIKNAGTAPVVFAAGAVPAPFATVNGETATLDPGQEHSFVVNYSPVVAGRDERTLILQIGAATYTRTLAGRAVTTATATAVVEGVVTGRNALGVAVPVSGARVGLRKMVSESDGYLRWIGRDAVTDALGRYRIENVPPSGYLVSVDMRGANPRIFYGSGYGGEPVDLSAGQTETVDFEFPLLPPVDPSDPKNYPVVLVRGKGDADVPSKEIAYWQAMRNALKARGFNQVWDPNEDGASRISGEMGIESNSKPLRDYLEGELEQYEYIYGIPPRKVNFVCHSMGGLILRQMLHDNAEGIYGPTLKLEGDVFMLSTPHAGSLLANIAPKVGDWREQWETIRDLRTGKLTREFSSHVRWPGSGLRLFLLGGTTFAGDDDLVKAGNILRFASPDLDKINDGAVTVLSSRGRYIAGDFTHSVGSKRIAFLSPPREVPAWDVETAITPIELPLNHYDIKSNASLADWIAGILLGGRPQAPNLGQPADLSVETPAQGGQKPDLTLSGPLEEGKAEQVIATQGEEGVQDSALPERVVESVSGAITAGATESFAFPVDSTQRLRAIYTGNSGVEFRLLTPGGLTIDPSTPGSDPTVTYTAAEADGELVAEYQISSPESGWWRMVVDAAGLAERASYNLRATVESDLTLETIQSEFVHPGAEIVFQAGLGTAPDGLLAIPGSTVSSLIVLPDGTALERTVADDGTQGDGEAGDGVFGRIEAGLAQPGEHRIFYRADGTRPETGIYFRRIVEQTFLVADSGGFISGEPVWKTVGADDAGFAGALLATVPVAVNAPGDYLLSAILRDDAQNREIRAVADFHRSEAGLSEVTITFDARDLPEQTIFGPFELRDLRLFRRDESDIVWLDRRDAPLEVDAQLYSQPSRSVRLSGDTAFGLAAVGQSVERTLTIHNDGHERMEIYGIESPAGFTASFTGSIEPGESVALTVTFSPFVEGAYQGDLAVDSNATSGSNRIAMSGEGVIIDFSVTGNDVEILPGASNPSLSDHTDFGTIPAMAGTTTRTFTIWNAGTGELELSEVWVSGTHASDFAITVQPRASVVRGDATTFEVTFDPSGLGVRSAVVRFENNDNANSPFTFSIAGFGGKVAQSIGFASPGDQIVNATVALSATGGGSGNPVTYAVTAGPGVIVGGSQLSFTGAGEVTITALQAGDDNYDDAPPVARTFRVAKAPAVVTLAGLNQAPNGLPRLVTSVTSPIGLTVLVTYNGDPSPPTAVGSYAVEATVSHPLYQGTATGVLVIDHRISRELAAPLQEAPLPDATDLVWEDVAASIYDGLLHDPDDGALLGAINSLLVTRPRAASGMGGGITGTVRLMGRSASLRGTFNAQGRFLQDFLQRDGSLLSVDLQLMRTGALYGEVIRGTVIWQGLPGQAVPVVAFANLSRAPYHAKNNPLAASPSDSGKAQPGIYTMLLPSQSGWGVSEPGGDGWATAVVSSSGGLTVRGILGDGTRFSEAAYLSGDHDASFYSEPYPSTPVRGIFGGKVTFRDQRDISDFDGELQWRTFPNPKSARYKDGFDIKVWALGSRFTPPAIVGQRVLDELANQHHNAELSLIGPTAPGVGGGLDRVVSWLGNNRLVHYGPVGLSATASAKSGSLSGSFYDPTTRLKVAFSGVAFQKQGLAAGVFLNGAYSGALRILPGTNFVYPGSEDAGSVTRLASPGTPGGNPVENSLDFTPNAAGVYGGILTDGGGRVTGALEAVNLTSGGGLSGSLWIEGVRYGFRGLFPANGPAEIDIPVTGNPKPIRLVLDLTGNTGGDWGLEGTVSLDDGVITPYSVDAQRRPVYTKVDRAPQEGFYTVAMRAPNSVDPFAEPGGDAHGILATSYLGTCTGLIHLPDGTKSSLGGHVGSHYFDGGSNVAEWSFHRGLYGKIPRGNISGKLYFRQTDGVGDLDGEWRWVKQAGAAPAAVYPSGFDVTRPVVGSRYLRPPNGIRAMDGLVNDWWNLWLRLAGPNLSTLPGVNLPELDRVATWTGSNRILYFGPESVKIAFDPKTGLWLGSYLDRTGGVSVRFGGVLIQKQSLVTGSYLVPGPTGPISGLFTAHPR